MTSYRVRQKLVAIGDDFWIEDDCGQRVFKVDGKALRLRKTLVFEDADGKELCTVQERKLRIRDSMEIEDPRGRPGGDGQESPHRAAPRPLDSQCRRRP